MADDQSHTELYDRLNVSKKATPEEIKRAYKKMALKYHPDRNKDEDAPEQFRLIQEAFEVLEDEEKRKIYDEYGLEGINGQGDGPKRTQNVAQLVPVTLEELYNGAQKQVPYEKYVSCSNCKGEGSTDGKTHTCEQCDGQGQVAVLQNLGFMQVRRAIECPVCEGEGVSIPPESKCNICNGKKIRKVTKIAELLVEKGMLDDEKITLRGQSHELPGCVPGDAIFVLSEQAHDTFNKRKGSHLYMVKNIPLVNALTGCQFLITHLDGRKLLIKTPPGKIVSPGMQLEIPKEGMPERKFASERGSLIITFAIDFPLALTPEQSSALVAALPDHLPKVALEDGEKAEEVELQEMVEGSHNTAEEADDESGSGGEGGSIACGQQ